MEHPPEPQDDDIADEEGVDLVPVDEDVPPDQGDSGTADWDHPKADPDA